MMQDGKLTHAHDEIRKGLAFSMAASYRSVFRLLRKPRGHDVDGDLRYNSRVPAVQTHSTYPIPTLIGKYP